MIDAGDDVAPASVIITTIGRAAELDLTLQALARAVPRADDVLVVDQSGEDAVAEVAARFEAVGVRHVRSAGRGAGLAANEGLRGARHEVVFFTDDDCAVESNWIQAGFNALNRFPHCIFTGRVLPLGNAHLVPTTALDVAPRDYTGDLYCSILVRSNLLVCRSAVLAVGGFDERFETSAEDDDLCYRWLNAGGCVRYDPDLVVWHRGWRQPSEVDERYVRYGEEQAWFYLKHLRRGDVRVLRFLGRDLRAAARGFIADVLRGRPGRDPRRSVARGLLRGVMSDRRRPGSQ
jgi:GT2 family glycosyltransferase